MGNREIKILMMGLTPPLEGGSERHIYEISKRIENATVFTQKDSICNNKIEVKVSKKSTFLRNISFFIKSFFYSLFLLFTFKKKYELIHIHENLLYFVAPILRLRYKIIITVHGIKGFKYYDNKFYWIFFRTVLRFADILIAVNLEDKILLEKYFKKVVYIPNGVDLSYYGNKKYKIENKITFIGRIHEQKGIIYLLKAFDSTKNQLKDFKLEIIGKEDEYANQLKKQFPDKNIIWRGFVSDRNLIAKYLCSSYCIVLPSLWEGLPLTLFESLASGRPLILSDIPAFKSVINNEAVFFKSQDSKDLADKILYLINNKETADKIAKKGLKLSEEYDWNKISEKLVSVYENEK
jgi:glycosyltransferase involved in cell wall biosynthesis